MIKSVELFEYESHKHTLVDFSTGLNVLAGESESGKSAVRRAINLVVNNRPSGSDYISWSNFDSKGKQINPCRVIITLINGTTVERIRSPELNGYVINGGLPLEAVGTSVPEQVTSLFNMKDFNIQAQLDRHFLISETAGEAARYLNQVVSLEAADEYQASMESKRRKCSSDITSTGKNITSLTGDVGKFKWIQKAEDLIAVIEAKEGKTKAFEAVIEDVTTSIREWGTFQQKLEACSCLPRAEELVVQINIALKNIQSLSAKVNTILSDIAKFQELQEDITAGACVGKAEKLVSGIEKMEQKAKTLQSSIATLEMSILRCKEHQKSNIFEEIIQKAEKNIAKITRFMAIKDAASLAVLDITNCMKKYTVAREERVAIKSELVPLESELALVDICPTCHRKMDDCKEVSF